MKFYRYLALFLLVNSLVVPNLQAQDLTDGIKSWFGYSVNVNIGKRFKGKFAQLYSVDLPDARFGFMQTDVTLAYKLTGRHYLQIEFSSAQYPWRSRHINFGFSNNPLGLTSYQRLTLNYNVSHKLLKKNNHLKLKHYAVAQLFFPQPEKHRVRFIYTLRIYYANKKWPWRISPYLASSLYYYLGGRPIIYYNNEGQITGYNSPNGYHRFRVKTGFSFRPFKNVLFNCTLYVIFQWEFNTGIFPNTDINYKRPISLDNVSYPFNPTSIKTQQPFNNYTAIGLHLSYRIKVALKKKNAR
ncbi:hypothetical protein [Aureispira anguillae]|uniref:Outer membrane protein beta-barrel domain-containing protein n=1 Tax=Aureispira anguillae TaxID=2864201 RepID=A0A915YBG7_9BACT|nr:hypothetical protein [Aureispira anguillae]BDS10010.1 hypothetical protein AsAng_0007150 [Aureispira anguillae]